MGDKVKMKRRSYGPEFKERAVQVVAESRNIAETVRQSVMDATYQSHPERFARDIPNVGESPQTVGINTRLKAIQW